MFWDDNYSAKDSCSNMHCTECKYAEARPMAWCGFVLSLSQIKFRSDLDFGDGEWKVWFDFSLLSCWVFMLEVPHVGRLLS